MKFSYKKAMGKSGKPYHCLEVNMGYGKEVLFVGDAVCANILGISQKELAALPCPTEKVLLSDEKGVK